jgi:hypothetical protein
MGRTVWYFYIMELQMSGEDQKRTKDELESILQAKWEEIEEMEEESGEAHDQWQSVLQELGCIGSVTGQYNWHPDNGAMVAIDELLELVNGDEKVFVVEDPSYVGYTGAMYFLVFRRSV